MARNIYNNLIFHISRFKIVYAGMILYDVKSEAIIRVIKPFNLMNDHQNVETPWEHLKTKRFRWRPLVPTPKAAGSAGGILFPRWRQRSLENTRKTNRKKLKGRKTWGVLAQSSVFPHHLDKPQRLFWCPVRQQRGEKKTWRPPVAFGLGGGESRHHVSIAQKDCQRPT